jgi:uncharacterized protein YrrD
MGERTDVLPVSGLVGRSVLSLSSGNILGTVRDVFIDPLNGLLIGFMITAPNGELTVLPFDAVHSIGGDAIMAASDDSVGPADETAFAGSPNFYELTGTKIITETGQLLGHIAGIFVTLSAEPLVFYEIRESLFDAFLGRHRFIPASAGNALSDDKQRLIVPDEAAEIASPTIDELLHDRRHVKSFSPAVSSASSKRGPDDTIVLLPVDVEDETVVRTRDEDETVVHQKDDDETVIRFRRKR